MGKTPAGGGGGFPALSITSPTYGTGRWANGLTGGSAVSPTLTLPTTTRSVGFWCKSNTGASLGGYSDPLITLSNWCRLNSGDSDRIEINGATSYSPTDVLTDQANHWIFVNIYTDGTTTVVYDNGSQQTYEGGGSAITGSCVISFNMVKWPGFVLSDFTVWTDSNASRATAPTGPLAGVTTGTYGTNRLVTWSLNSTGAGA